MSINPVSHGHSGSSDYIVEQVRAQVAKLEEGGSSSEIISTLKQIQKLAPSCPQLSGITSQISEQIASIEQVQGILPAIVDGLAHRTAQMVSAVLAGHPIEQPMLDTSAPPVDTLSNYVSTLMQNPAFQFLAFGTPQLTNADLKSDLTNLIEQGQAFYKWLFTPGLIIQFPTQDIMKMKQTLLYLINLYGTQNIAGSATTQLNSFPSNSSPASVSELSGPLKQFAQKMTGFDNPTGIVQSLISQSIVDDSNHQFDSFFADRLPAILNNLRNGQTNPTFAAKTLMDASRLITTELIARGVPGAANIQKYFMQVITTGDLKSFEVITAPLTYFANMLCNPTLTPPSSERLGQQALALQSKIGTPNWQEAVFGSDSNMGPLSQLFAGYILSGGVGFKDAWNMVIQFENMLPWDSSNTNTTAVNAAFNAITVPLAEISLSNLSQQVSAQLQAKGIAGAQNVLKFFQLILDFSTLSTGDIQVLYYALDYMQGMISGVDPTPSSDLYDSASQLQGDLGDNNWQTEIFGSNPGTGPMAKLFVGYILSGQQNFTKAPEVFNDFSSMMPWDSPNQNTVNSSLVDLLNVFAQG